MTIDTVVFDVLGTLVDHDGGLRAAVAALVPGADGERLEAGVADWHRHVATEHRRVVAGERAYVTADVLDREAALRVAPDADVADLERAASVTARLDAWPDTAELLERLAARYAVVALSNADHATLLRLDAHAGLRWHAALSTETVRSYKPDPAVYRAAIAHVARPPEHVLMVAAHSWDLRAARAAGLRTAYLDRPGGDAPAPDDAFDHHFADVAALLATYGRQPAAS
ncbi:haloacid dehalogenase type II [Actinomycetospora aeridis]|uniref:Haloacid dehalogenase type II n=1 Tax=Actinomycetospora aeridis TaxID=3129231 RepID=A0ABU8NGV7_9PSEU